MIPLVPLEFLATAFRSGIGWENAGEQSTLTAVPSLVEGLFQSTQRSEGIAQNKGH